MENRIKPIQTNYKGHRFRSRLEARWAVFFDAIGADWEYEPEGFDLGDGLYYLPDFVLHNVKGINEEPYEPFDLGVKVRDGSTDLYIEVKPYGKMNYKDIAKVFYFTQRVAPILLVGNIPFEDNLCDLLLNDGSLEGNFKTVIPKIPKCHHDVIRFCSEITVNGNFHPAYLVKTKNGVELMSLCSSQIINNNSFFETEECKQIESATFEAYRKARSARFEHGEKG